MRNRYEVNLIEVITNDDHVYKVEFTKKGRNGMRKIFQCAHNMEAIELARTFSSLIKDKSR